jgi:hypothetical protein
VLAGPGPDDLESAGSAPRKGFETGIKVQTAEPYVSVRAKNSTGKVLGAAKTLKPGG